MKIRRRSVVPTTTTMALMTLKAALILVSGLRAAIASASAAVAETLPASFEEIGLPSECKEVSEPGDHMMVQYDFTKVGDSEPLFQVKSWEQQYYVLGSEGAPPAFNAGLVGMCAGEVRKLTYTASAFQISEAHADAMFTATVTLLSLTKPDDYAVFAAIDSGDVGTILDMVDNHTGVNAVDRYGNSALMSAVSVGGSMQMAVASLLNSWRPKVDVNFVKPSGHSVLFYAVVQEESRGTMILKALLKRGADPNRSLKQPDSLGWTPLHYACRHENIKHAQMLLDFGADPFAETDHGLSVLDAASKASYSVRKKLADILNEAVARMEEEEEDGEAASKSPAQGGAASSASSGEL